MSQKKDRETIAELRAKLAVAEKDADILARLRSTLAPLKKRIDSIALRSGHSHSLMEESSVTGSWSTWFALSVLLAGTEEPASRDWLQHEAAIEQHLVQRLQDWRAAGWPPAQTFFTSGLERLVAALIEFERVPMPGWLKMRLAEDESFREKFYRELVDTVRDGSTKGEK